LTLDSFPDKVLDMRFLLSCEVVFVQEYTSFLHSILGLAATFDPKCLGLSEIVPFSGLFATFARVCPQSEIHLMCLRFDFSA
jgi:hypothetical protein